MRVGFGVGPVVRGMRVGLWLAVGFAVLGGSVGFAVLGGSVGFRVPAVVTAESTANFARTERKNFICYIITKETHVC